LESSAAARVQVLPPFRLAPLFDKRIWGFQDLAPWFDYKTSGDPIGEVWLTGDNCLVDTGSLAGRSLKQATADHGAAILGAQHAGEDFPLLIKMLFPKDKLSVQVHPDDAMAQKYGEPRGKTECWYTLQADPGASVALGLKPGVSKEQVRSAIADATLEDLLVYVPVTKGDLIFVDAGTVHAILPGSVLLETQQNSDTTYRLYDYGRPRELHLEKGLEAIRSDTRAGRVAPRQEGNHTLLINERYFRVDRFVVEGAISSDALAQDHKKQLQILFVADGAATVSGEGFDSFPLSRCQVAVIPASAGAWELESKGKLELIRMIPQNEVSAR